METVVDLDERVLSLAQQQARQEGRPLGALVEDALRAVLSAHQRLPEPAESGAGSVEGDDAFFSALEEIRALGRFSASRRHVNLP